MLRLAMVRFAYLSNHRSNHTFQIMQSWPHAVMYDFCTEEQTFATSITPRHMNVVRDTVNVVRDTVDDRGKRDIQLHFVENVRHLLHGRPATLRSKMTHGFKLDYS